MIKVESVKAVDSLIYELKEFRKIVAKYEKENAQTKSKKENTPEIDVTIATLSSLGYSKKEIEKMLKKEGKKSSKKANKK